MEKDYEEIIDFLNVFEKRYKEESNKLPFPVNLIECIGIDEVGHSRILAKLLEYKNSQGKYVILESLIKRLGFEPKAKEPLITQEKERIDIWVRDKDYAIIFENKACDANDQESQICRYIKATLARGYKKEQIYIVYLPSDEKEPEDQSWNELKQEFASRYKNFPFRSEVLPWLRDLQSIIEEKEVKEVYLRSVLNQYIDYWEGIDGIRTNEKIMNMELEKVIKKKWSIDDNDVTNSLKVLNEKIEVLNQMKQSAAAIQNEFLKKKVVELMKDNEYIVHGCSETKVDSTWCGFIIEVPNWGNHIFKVAGQDYDVLDKATPILTGKFEKNAAELKACLENSPEDYVNMIIEKIKNIKLP